MEGGIFGKIEKLLVSSCLQLDVDVVASVDLVLVDDLGVVGHDGFLGGAKHPGDLAQGVAALDLVDDVAKLFGGLAIATGDLVHFFDFQFKDLRHFYFPHNSLSFSSFYFSVEFILNGKELASPDLVFGRAFHHRLASFDTRLRNGWQ